MTLTKLLFFVKCYSPTTGEMSLQVVADNIDQAMRESSPGGNWVVTEAKYLGPVHVVVP